MTEYLVFRLYAPLASWGEAAVGETRPTATHPGRGAIIGLLAAALGIKREDEAEQRALCDSVHIAIKQRSPGILLRDYHTAQVPAAQAKVTYRTRRDELNAPRKVLNTILSSRDYRCDGLWTAAVWLTEGANHTLEALETALRRPSFPLYLGRKSCPLAAPLAPRRVEAEHLRGALDSVFDEVVPGEKRVLRLPDDVLYAWEGGPERLDGHDQVSGVQSSEVWDRPLNRRRWQFGPRVEFRRLEHHGEKR
ncbi:type I-E CRISPR-associated protein Cas5/CasD [Halomonas sp. 25-S5]|uniref:type I-E CRISPR-associated protein Cas5/CasD n=1 Tax=Halomonas sp. 25-S5 TaxID=2994065 RepID=UPI00246944CC|nr:type I-E CRISPR-associated protein Cas5/CasD [Halomonas sp. 25-S5]